MSTTVPGFCNVALSHLQREPVVISITDPIRKEEEYCQTYYPIARDMTLARHNWGFAGVHAQLGESGTAPTGWLYQYGLPPDYISARKVYISGTEDRQDYEEGNTGSKRVIWTNAPQAFLFYTARIETVTMFPPMFVLAGSYALAAMLAGALAEDRRLQANMWDAYERVFSESAIIDSKNEKQGGPAKEPRNYTPGKTAARA